MPAENKTWPRQEPGAARLEERGIAGDIVNSVVSGGVGGAVSAWVGSKLGGQGGDPPEPPPPPRIELPPGVDRD